uniref:Uncharacterized protein n=1 Tax=Oryza meridionalis TaxID=40149 RepID=A0A0E0EBC7_9ORYZ
MEHLRTALWITNNGGLAHWTRTEELAEGSGGGKLTRASLQVAWRELDRPICVRFNAHSLRRARQGIQTAHTVLDCWEVLLRRGQLHLLGRTPPRPRYRSLASVRGQYLYAEGDGQVFPRQEQVPQESRPWNSTVGKVY